MDKQFLVLDVRVYLSVAVLLALTLFTTACDQNKNDNGSVNYINPKPGDSTKTTSTSNAKDKSSGPKSSDTRTKTIPPTASTPTTEETRKLKLKAEELKRVESERLRANVLRKQAKSEPRQVERDWRPENASKKRLPSRVARRSNRFVGLSDGNNQPRDGSKNREVNLAMLKSPSAQKRPKKAGNGKEKQTWKPSRLQPHHVRLKVGDKETLPLKALQASVKIDGFRARVVLDYFFLNTSKRMLEGNFQLRLPNGASPYYLAFGQSRYQFNPQSASFRGFVNNQRIRLQGFDPAQTTEFRKVDTIAIKEARMVPKVTAARAYHMTVRRRIDPALLEWTGAGVFNGRVYPIQPGKLHRVVIGYDINLKRNGNTLDMDFVLPKQALQRKVNFEVAKLSGVRISSSQTLQSDETQDYKYFYVENPKSDTLSIKISSAKAMGITGPDISLQKSAPKNYFSVRLTPETPKQQPNNLQPNAIFVLDRSLSAAPQQFNRSVQLLEKILASNEAGIREFAVLTFNVRTRWWQTKYVPNNAASRKSLRNYLSQLALEGATDLELALRQAYQPTPPSLQRNNASVFLISDGSANWGNVSDNALARTLDKHKPLYVFSTSTSGVNQSLLSRLAGAGNGAYYSVTTDQAITKAANAIQRRSWSIQSIRVTNSKGDLKDIIIQGRPTQLFPGQTLLLAGRGRLDKKSKVILTLSNGVKQIKTGYPVTQTVASPLAFRSYGQLAVEQMESYQPGSTDKTVGSYGLHFRVTGKNNSLLMLESEADYKRFNIKPQATAFVVKSSTANEVLAGFIQSSLEKTLNDKQVFSRLLQRLQNDKVIRTDVGQNLQLYFKKLPAGAFALNFETAPLESGSERLRKKLPAGYLKALNDIDNNNHVIAQQFERLIKQNGDQAVIALSNLVEQSPGNLDTLRRVSFYLMAHDKRREAYYLLQQIANKRPYNPQVWLFLARIAQQQNKYDLSGIYYEIVLNSKWDNRYRPSVELARLEYTQLLAEVKRKSDKSHFPDYALARFPQLRKSSLFTKGDLVVSIEWNTRGSDIDLHVREPTGEEIFFKRKRSKQGATLSNDITRGFGPEYYQLKKGINGMYRIGVKYYRGDNIRKSLRSAVYLQIFKNFGKPNQSVERRVIVLQKSGQKRWIAKTEIAH